MRGASCGAIAAKKVEAAEALKLTAPDLLKAGIIDEIVREPIGGAHTDPDAAAAFIDQALTRELAEVSALDVDDAARSSATTSSGTWGGWGSISWMRVVSVTTQCITTEDTTDTEDHAHGDAQLSSGSVNTRRIP